MKAFLPLLTVLLWVLCFPGLEAARADGIVISERALKPLEIPGQTGVILHRDGKETLTIWNKVQSDASPMAWVLPLPSVPEVIQETDPAAVRLLQLAAAPRIRYRVFGLGGLIFSGVCLLLGAVLLVARRQPNSGEITARVVVVLLIVMLVAGAFSGYGSAGPAEQSLKPEGLQILTIQETGSYTTTVIQGESIGQVNEWLAAKGFSAFAGDQAKAAESYIAGKWVFLCVKLKAAAPGLTGLRPLTVRFASKDVIYPMRLTQGAGTVPVDLYVMSRETMEDPTGRLKLVVNSDLFLRVGGRPGHSLGYALVALGDARDKSWDQRHQSSAFPLSHEDELPEMPFIPSGKDVLLDGLLAEPEARIFHLSGVFTPASDWSDIKLVPTKTKVQGVRYRTWKAWMLESMQSSFGVFAVIAFLMIALFAMEMGPVGIRPGWQWSVAACLVALGILGLGLHHNSANTVFIEESRVANAAPGSPESFTGLLDAWLRSLTKPP